MRFSRLVSCFFLLVLAFAHTLRAQQLITLASSDFEMANDLDGWHGTNNSGNTRPVTYVTGGPTSNSTGYISMVEGVADGAFNHFIAPVKFLGDKRAAYNGFISFYHRQSATSGYNAGLGIIQFTSGTNHLAFDLPYPPEANFWHHFIIPLNENAGWHFTISTNDVGTTNHLATRDEMLSVLSALTLVEIRAEWSSVNNEVDDIDDVMLLGQPSGLATPEVAPVTFAGVTIDGAVGSTYRIDYQNVSDVSSNWLTLTNITLPVSPYFLIDASTPTASSRSYRAVLLP